MYSLLRNYSVEYYTTDSTIKVQLSRASGTPDWGNNYSFSITRAHHYLVKLSNLPPNAIFDFTFNDLYVRMYADANGEYHFIQPLPVALLPHADMRIEFTNTAMTYPTNPPYPYMKAYGYFTDDVLPSTDQMDPINIESYEENAPKIITLFIVNGTIVTAS